MEIKAKSHIPVETYGFIEVEYSFDDEIKDGIRFKGNKIDFHKEMINDYYAIKERFNKPLNASDPLELGESMIENGHTYKAVMNEKTKELYWQINKI